MYIISFILLIFGLNKIFFITQVNYNDIKTMADSIDYVSEGMVKGLLGLILFDGLLEVVIGLFILL